MAEIRTTSSTGGQKGVKLERFDLIPTGPLRELAEHYGVGASKYANHQWRQGYEWSKSFAALSRHLAAFWGGEDFDVCSNDPEGCSHVDAEGRPFEAVREDACFNHTGSHHMAAVAWHAFALLEFKDRFPEHDDRYVPEAFAGPQPESVIMDEVAEWGIKFAPFVQTDISPFAKVLDDLTARMVADSETDPGIFAKNGYATRLKRDYFDMPDSFRDSSFISFTNADDTGPDTLSDEVAEELQKAAADSLSRRIHLSRWTRG